MGGMFSETRQWMDSNLMTTMIDLVLGTWSKLVHLDTFLEIFGRVMKKMRLLFPLEFNLLDIIIIELPEDILPS